MPSNTWIVRTKPQPRLRLFCFPYAGGGASIFRLWSEALPAEVEVCPIYLPGRERRLGEPLFNRLPPLVEALTHALKPFLDIPFAFFGHSLGALIAFELARRLRSTSHQAPIQLFVSAHRAPQLPDTHPILHNLSDTAFLDALSRLGGTPAVVRNHAELMQLMLPVLQADFAIYETYIYSPQAPLDCPITAFGGEQDTLVSAQELLPWREQTSRSFTLRMLPGDHFFLLREQNLLLQAIAQDLSF